jgi:hypothetical protein
MRSRFLVVLPVAAFIAAGVLGGCGDYAMQGKGAESDLRARSVAPQSADAEPEAVSGETPDLLADRKMLWRAWLTVAVADSQEAVDRTRGMARELGGYVERMTNDRVVLRVPAEQFDPAMERLADMGPVLDRKVEAVDVTEQHTDLAGRLKNQRALLKQLRELLDRAEDVKKAMEVEQEIARVQAEIERLERRLRQIDSKVAYSTITVDFVRSAEAPASTRSNLPFYWLNTLGLDTLMAW